MSFNKGYTTGNNAYLSVWINSYIVANNYGISDDLAGETISFVNTFVNNNAICGVQNNSGGLLRFFAGGIDYNGTNGGGPAICGSNVWIETHGTHMEQYTGPTINLSNGGFHNVYIDGGELQYTTGRQNVTNVALVSNVATVMISSTYGYFAGSQYIFGTLTNATWLNGQTVTLTGVNLSTDQITFSFVHANYSSTSESGNIAPAMAEAGFVIAAGTGEVRLGLNNVNFISGHQVTYYVYDGSLSGSNNYLQLDNPKWESDACGTATGPGTCTEPISMSQTFGGNRFFAPVNMYSSLNVAGASDQDTYISAGTGRSLTLGANNSGNLVQLAAISHEC